MTAPLCLHCGQPCRLTSGKEVYPKRVDLHDKPIWRCDPCNASCGCHPGTTTALGRPANKIVKGARMMVHAKLDPMWKQFQGNKKRRARSAIYGILAEKMNLTRDEAHTALFNLEQCRLAWTALSTITKDDIEARIH